MVHSGRVHWGGHRSGSFLGAEFYIYRVSAEVRKTGC